MTTTVRRVSPASNGGVYRYVPRTGLWDKLNAQDIRDGYEAYQRERTHEDSDNGLIAYRRSIRRWIVFDHSTVRRNLFVMSRRIYDTMRHEFRVAEPELYLQRCTSWSYSVDQAERHEASLERRLSRWFPDEETKRWILSWFGQLLHGRRTPTHQFVLWLMTNDERLSRLLIRTFDRYAYSDIPPPSKIARTLRHKRLLLIDHSLHGRKLNERNLQRALNCSLGECGLCVISSLPPIIKRIDSSAIVGERIAACRVCRSGDDDDDNDDDDTEGLIHAFFRRLTIACREIPPPSIGNTPRSLLDEANLHVTY